MLDIERQKLAYSFKHENDRARLLHFVGLFAYTGLWIYFQLINGDEQSLFIKFLSLNLDFTFALIVFYIGYTFFQLPVNFLAYIWIPKKYGFAVESIPLYVFKYIFFSIMHLGRNLFIIGFFYWGVNNYLEEKSFLFIAIVVGLMGVILLPNNVFNSLDKLFTVNKNLETIDAELNKEILEYTNSLEIKLKHVYIYESQQGLMSSDIQVDLHESKIAIGSRLFNQLSSSEVKAIIAQRIGFFKAFMEIKYYRLLNFFLAMIYPSVIFYFFILNTGFIMKSLNLARIESYLVPFFFMISLLYTYMIPLIYIPLYRKLEMKADDFAVSIVGKEKYISSLIKLVNINLIYYALSTQWKSNIIYPTVVDRIERLKNA